MKFPALPGIARTVGLAIAVGALSIGAVRAEHNNAAAPEQRVIERTIHQYLIDHPEVVLEVLDVLRKRQQAEDAERTRANLAAHRDERCPRSPFGDCV